MLDNLKNMLDKGIDYAQETTDKITRKAQELARENNLTREDAKKLLEYVQKKSDEARQNIDSSVQDYIRTYLQKLDIPTREDVNKLEARIKKLESARKKPAKTVKKPAAPRKKE